LVLLPNREELALVLEQSINRLPGELASRASAQEQVSRKLEVG